MPAKKKAAKKLKDVKVTAKKAAKVKGGIGLLVPAPQKVRGT